MVKKADTSLRSRFDPKPPARGRPKLHVVPMVRLTLSLPKAHRDWLLKHAPTKKGAPRGASAVVHALLRAMVRAHAVGEHERVDESFAQLLAQRLWWGAQVETEAREEFGIDARAVLRRLRDAHRAAADFLELVPKGALEARADEVAEATRRVLRPIRLHASRQDAETVYRKASKAKRPTASR